MDAISFARGVPAPELLPVEELADCAKTAIERGGASALLYGHTLGYQPLREWIGQRHDVDPARVVVTNGSLQAFHFVLSAFAGAGWPTSRALGRFRFSRTIPTGWFVSRASRR